MFSLLQFFRTFSKYEFTPEETDAVFEAIVWPMVRTEFILNVCHCYESRTIMFLLSFPEPVYAYLNVFP